MSNIYEKCLLAPFVLDRQGIDTLILTLLAAIVDEMEIDTDEMLRKSQEVIDKL